MRALDPLEHLGKSVTALATGRFMNPTSRQLTPDFVDGLHSFGVVNDVQKPSEMQSQNLQPSRKIVVGPSTSTQS